MGLTKAERVRKYGEVFTPARIVREMCDGLEQGDMGCFEPERSFLEPACGDGAFLLEILRRKFERCRKRDDFTAALGSVYGFEIQADNVAACIDNVERLCARYFKLTGEERQIINDHVILCDGLKVMKLLASSNHQGSP